MDNATIVELVKARLGISSEVRDAFLTAIVDSVQKEIEDEKGLVLDGTNPYHLMFVVDYATWRYQNVENSETSSGRVMLSMPRHLQYRLHNLMIHVGANNLQVDSVVTVDVLPDTSAANTVYILSTDGSKQMEIDGDWATVDFINGWWMVVTA